MTGDRKFVEEISLGEKSSRTVYELVDQLVSGRSNTDLDEWLSMVGEVGQGLPPELRHRVEEMKDGTGKPALLVRGLGLSTVDLPPTPGHWRDCRPLDSDSPTLRHETALILFGQALGESFGYASLQNGRLIHHLLPIAGAETDQSGHGSKATLEWHTEDAFTPFRADHLALVGMRNDDEIATTVCGIDALRGLDPRDESILKEPRFLVVPDDEHVRGRSRSEGPSILPPEDEGGVRLPILGEGPRGRRLIIDSVYMSPTDAEAGKAFGRASELIDASLERISVGPGEILILDNRRVVHGRESFRPRFDGSDRWLLKLSVAESLSGSSIYRRPHRDRVLR